MRLVVLLFCLLLGFGAENAYAKAPAKNTPAKSAPAKKAAKAKTKSASKSSATKKTDAQINEQKNALKTLAGLIGNGRTVLMGDLNVLPDDPVLLPIRERMYDTAQSFSSLESGLSFPSDRPDRKIDYIFTTKDIKVLKAEIPAAAVSDHRPYIADAEI